MTLRKRTLLIIGVTFSGLILLSYAVCRPHLLQGYAELEQLEIRKSIERVANSFADKLEPFGSTTSDWAAWDETYAFIEDHNQSYLDTNVVDSTFIRLRINLIVYVDSAGKIAFSRAFDWRNHQPADFPENFRAYLAASDFLYSRPGAEKEITGLLALPGANLLVAARPILTSNENGPNRGTLIMGRYFDEQEVKELAEITKLSLTSYQVNDQWLPPDIKKAISPLLTQPQANPTFVQQLDQGAIAAYTVFRDIYEKPALILRTDMPRKIYAQGKTAISYFLWELVIVGLVVGLTCLWLMTRMVLNPLHRLGEEVADIAASGDLSSRVSAAGKDELASFAGTVNGMLARLQELQLALQTSNAQLQQEIIERREIEAQLEKTSRHKSEFLASMSHDLRTPLNAIIGFSQLMLDRIIPGEVNAEQQQCLTDILTSSDQLLKLINEVLDLSRIESGRLELNCKEVIMAEVVQDAAAIMMPLFAARKQELGIRVAKDLPLVHADEPKVQQVLINLLSNANKHTLYGGRIEVEVTENGEGWCLVSVLDTGAGIRQEDQQHLFEPFYQAASPEVTREGGTGLGLAIARQLIEAHGGRIWLESSGASGSKFCFTLPMSNDTRQ